MKYSQDSELTAEQLALIEKISPRELQKIDKALLSNTDSNYFRKVARIVGTTMSSYPEHIEGLPDVFYAQRIRSLVKNGYLESQGNLQFMRFSEVRIISKNENS